ncbi:MAG TPA: hypothetical protein VEQ85_10445, partial [Lacipirellulaceae bacterium]|nr:hypothetical protein [Lacipirellulaceae bacterium]
NDRFVMALKDELRGAKNIWLATSDSASGGFVRGTAPVIGPGSGVENNAVEGPSLIKIGNLWHLYYDAYGANYLGLATSPDLMTWTNRTSQTTQPSGHHGTVFAAPKSAIGWTTIEERSDLNLDGLLDLQDWSIFRAYQHVSMTGWSASLRASRGDLNNSGKSDYQDFRLFQADYDLVHGEGSFAAALGPAPEPGGLALASAALLALGACRRRLAHRRVRAARA